MALKGYSVSLIGSAVVVLIIPQVYKLHLCEQKVQILYYILYILSLAHYSLPFTVLYPLRVPTLQLQLVMS